MKPEEGMQSEEKPNAGGLDLTNREDVRKLGLRAGQLDDGESESEAE